MKTKQSLKFYIKQRSNPQLGIYYIRKGQMTKAAAKAAEQSVYGNNTMLAYDTEEAYNQAIKELEAAGKTVQ